MKHIWRVYSHHLAHVLRCRWRKWKLIDYEDIWTSCTNCVCGQLAFFAAKVCTKEAKIMFFSSHSFLAKHFVIWWSSLIAFYRTRISVTFNFESHFSLVVALTPINHFCSTAGWALKTKNSAQFELINVQQISDEKLKGQAQITWRQFVCNPLN